MGSRANTYQVAGKACLVTGAASGFGSLLAIQLALKGAKVAMVDRNEKLGAEVLAKTRKLLEERGTSKAEAEKRVIFVNADLSSMDDVEKAFKTAIDAFGTLDVVVNNAGISESESFVDGPNPRAFVKMLDVNLRAVILGTKLAIDIFNREGKPGVIVNTASMAAIHEVLRLAAYASAKAGVLHLTRSLKPLGKTRGIRVNAVLPGAVMTPLVLTALRDPELKKWSYPDESEEDVIRRSVPAETVAEGMMMCIEDQTLAGEGVQVNARGIAVLDFNARRPKPVSREWRLDWNGVSKL
ncbi:hypothetical protein DFJ74DRAFT_704638 [Hyaloraphidium curvatum]|nr:hypothetical protein DFJ74DRAFT_704638 [Hyaloraphidium curvatum]